ncbi:MAG: SURF1 family protein [Cohaesibacter sp.]|nr:SURF1 family protein [Cohaesibacter sp.]
MTNQPKVPRIWPLSLAALIAFLCLISLGTWQWKRLAWKENLIATVSERLDKPAIAAPGPDLWDNVSRQGHLYKKVELRGHYDHSKEIHVWFALNKPQGGKLYGPGYLILTKFTTLQGWDVIVNRGFVPEAMKQPSSRPMTLTKDEQYLTGLIRFDEPKTWLSPPADTQNNVWIVRQVAEMRQYLDLSAHSTAPYWIDLTKGQGEAGLPQGGETLVTFSNNHLQYMLTWYALAVVLFGVYLAWLIKALRGPSRKLS